MKTLKQENFQQMMNGKHYDPCLFWRLLRKAGLKVAVDSLRFFYGHKERDRHGNNVTSK